MVNRVYGGVLGTEHPLNMILSPGVHRITLQVIDSSGWVRIDAVHMNGWRIFLPRISR
jgi:hypothetical protein